MIYIWISMLINQLSFFFLESGMREWTVLLKEVTWLPLIMIQTDSEIWTMTVRFSWIKNLPTITLWEKSHENVHCNFFFKGNVLHFILKEFHSIVSPKSISDQIKGTFMWKETFTMAFIISEKIIQFLLLSEIIWNAPIMWISGILSPRLCEPHNKVSTKWKP